MVSISVNFSLFRFKGSVILPHNSRSVPGSFFKLIIDSGTIFSRLTEFCVFYHHRDYQDFPHF